MFIFDKVIRKEIHQNGNEYILRQYNNKNECIAEMHLSKEQAEEVAAENSITIKVF